MTGRPLRIVEPDDLPTPRVDNDTTIIVTEAVDALAALRTAYWLGDSADHLHALASLIAQAQLLFPSAIHYAREQNHSWTEIGQLLNLTPAAAARRYRKHQ